MMNLDNYYLHATGHYEGKANRANNIIDILYGNYILPSCSFDEICLCDTTKKQKSIHGIQLKSAFIHYVEKSPTLCLNRQIKVFTPRRAITPNYDKKITDLYDEVRTKKPISLDHLELITFPIWPVHYNLQYDENIIFWGIDNSWKIKNLNIFRKNIELIKKEFSMIQVKDLYSGEDLTLDFIDERIEQFRK